jgi:Rrf2 family nitric oxide-sensitive transcriptional repressor
MYLASCEKEICTAKEIAQCFNISQNHMVKVVHNLSKSGYVNSKKGKGGGISLAKPDCDIVIGDVIRATETSFDIVECFNQKDNKCKISSVCELKNILSNAFKAFLNELDKYTLLDITKNKNLLKAIIDNESG